MPIDSLMILSKPLPEIGLKNRGGYVLVSRDGVVEIFLVNVDFGRHDDDEGGGALYFAKKSFLE